VCVCVSVKEREIDEQKDRERERRRFVIVFKSVSVCLCTCEFECVTLRERREWDKGCEIKNKDRVGNYVMIYPFQSEALLQAVHVEEKASFLTFMSLWILRFFFERVFNLAKRVEHTLCRFIFYK
jgi:hypothetical protein